MGDELEPERGEEDKEISELLLSIMDGYSDDVIPMLSQLHQFNQTVIDETAYRSRKRSRSEDTESRQEGIAKERDRRVKMTEMFTVLQSMVPNLFPKTTRTKIVNDTIDYIQFLEKEREKLEHKKSEQKVANRMIAHCNIPNSTVGVTTSGDITFFGIQTPVRRSLLTGIVAVFEKHNAEVLAANVAVNGQQLTVTITAFVDRNGGDDAVETIKADILILLQV